MGDRDLIVEAHGGILDESLLIALEATIGAGRHAWAYWPREHAVETVDRDRAEAGRPRHRDGVRRVVVALLAAAGVAARSRRGRLARESMGEILSRSVEISGNDARPLVKVYTRDRLRTLFQAFRDVAIVQRQLTPEELPLPLRPLRAMVERVARWNLIVKAVRA